ncbi:hypothetical protein CBOM_05644 [Ceraceosorus bombacis]|uniref:Uncharacterized protein n=1 Tax=Ceraceosorus bombacis TaxID=401625 RepID=A0A0N7LBB8_9BASI|nr:hypothetical protein CBOM_05644 [Ceraceosorus bombacis]
MPALAVCMLLIAVSGTVKASPPAFPASQLNIELAHDATHGELRRWDIEDIRHAAHHYYVDTLQPFGESHHFRENPHTFEVIHPFQFDPPNRQAVVRGYYKTAYGVRIPNHLKTPNQKIVSHGFRFRTGEREAEPYHANSYRPTTPGHVHVKPPARFTQAQQREEAYLRSFGAIQRYHTNRVGVESPLRVHHYEMLESAKPGPDGYETVKALAIDQTNRPIRPTYDPGTIEHDIPLSTSHVPRSHTAYREAGRDAPSLSEATSDGKSTVSSSGGKQAAAPTNHSTAGTSSLDPAAPPFVPSFAARPPPSTLAGSIWTKQAELRKRTLGRIAEGLKSAEAVSALAQTSEQASSDAASHGVADIGRAAATKFPTSRTFLSGKSVGRPRLTPEGVKMTQWRDLKALEQGGTHQPPIDVAGDRRRARLLGIPIKKIKGRPRKCAEGCATTQRTERRLARQAAGLPPIQRGRPRLRELPQVEVAQTSRVISKPSGDGKRRGRPKLFFGGGRSTQMQRQRERREAAGLPKRPTGRPPGAKFVQDLNKPPSRLGRPKQAQQHNLAATSADEAVAHPSLVFSDPMLVPTDSRFTQSASFHRIAPDTPEQGGQIPHLHRRSLQLPCRSCSEPADLSMTERGDMVKSPGAPEAVVLLARGKAPLNPKLPLAAEKLALLPESLHEKASKRSWGGLSLSRLNEHRKWLRDHGQAHLLNVIMPLPKPGPPKPRSKLLLGEGTPQTKSKHRRILRSLGVDKDLIWEAVPGNKSKAKSLGCRRGEPCTLAKTTLIFEKQRAATVENIRLYGIAARWKGFAAKRLEGDFGKSASRPIHSASGSASASRLSHSGETDPHLGHKGHQSEEHVGSSRDTGAPRVAEGVTVKTFASSSSNTDATLRRPDFSVARHSSAQLATLSQSASSSTHNGHASLRSGPSSPLGQSRLQEQPLGADDDRHAIKGLQSTPAAQRDRLVHPRVHDKHLQTSTLGHTVDFGHSSAPPKAAHPLDMLLEAARFVERRPPPRSASSIAPSGYQNEGTKRPASISSSSRHVSN